MLDKTKLKMLDRNVYFREKQEGVYIGKHPEMRVRQATKAYLTKKEALKGVSEDKENHQEELLTDLLDNIRAILTNEGVEHIKAKRQAGELK